MKTIIPLITLATLGTSHAALFSSGELDFGVILEGGSLEIEGHVVNGIVDGNTTLDVEFEATDLEVLAGVGRQFPAPSGFAAAGVTEGQSIWILPQSEEVGVPYIALASEELTSGDWTTPITFSLGSVMSPSGSGTFSMWESTSLGGQDFFFSSTNSGATENGNQYVSNFGHNHLNWGFSEPGTWAVELTAAGTHGTLGNLTATSTLNFVVVPEPSTSLLVSLCSLGFLIRRNRK